MTANSFVAKTLKCVPYVTQFRFGWTFNSFESQGVEKFVREFLPQIRVNNPDVHFWLHRSTSKCDAYMICVYEHSRTKKLRLNYYSANQILAAFEELSIGGDFRPGRKRGIQTRVPRGMQVLEREDKGRDVFKIHSKLNR